MSTVITGEAVVLELREASFVPRAVGCLIDYLVYALALLGTVVLLGETTTLLDESAATAMWLGISLFWLLAVPVAVETLTRGKSLGRAVMGLRIVRDDGGSIRFRHAFIRGMLALLEVLALFGSLALIVAFSNERGKRLGDMLAGTYSMRERRARFTPQLPPVPTRLQPWAELADLGRVPDALAAQVVRFVRQSASMTPRSRERVGAELATQVHAFVAPAPPPGTGAEDFLTAVMAERRNRDFQRLSAAKERQRAVAERLHRLPFQGTR
ncbi:RDD family protein [Zafaria sp. Z1313]|uniref:RDD family protein n=1 Tax=unclassified Zafaria TaxID=2828765 RepID=UPI002E78AAA8|nr:RDD family protein [Zafaria sp. J156]MEE1619953.1 RDD family protein [Zafaria sp. J156]